MFDFWKEELTQEQADALIDKAVEEITRRKLEAAAIVFFESHKSLAYVSSQASILFAPFLVPFLGYDFVNDYSRLLAKREHIETLLTRLENRRNAAPPKEDPCPMQS